MDKVWALIIVWLQ